MSDIKVITAVQRRRRWTPDEKRALVEEAEQPGMSISAVARKYDIHPNSFSAGEGLCDREHWKL